MICPLVSENHGNVLQWPVDIGSRLELFVDHHLIDEKCVKKWKRDPGEVKIAVSEWSFANYSETKANPELGTDWSTALWSADCMGHFMKNNFWLAAYWYGWTRRWYLLPLLHSKNIGPTLYPGYWPHNTGQRPFIFDQCWQPAGSGVGTTWRGQAAVSNHSEGYGSGATGGNFCYADGHVSWSTLPREHFVVGWTGQFMGPEFADVVE